MEWKGLLSLRDPTSTVYFLTGSVFMPKDLMQTIVVMLVDLPILNVTLEHKNLWSNSKYSVVKAK